MEPVEFVVQDNPSESTHEGWRRLINKAPLQKPDIEARAYFGLSSEERRPWLHRRLRYNQAAQIEHPRLRQVLKQAREMLEYNRFIEDGVGESRSGLIIDGVPRTGKTKAAIRVAREHALRELAEAEAKGLDPNDVHPVVYTDLRGPTTNRNMAAQLLGFFITPPKSGRMTAEAMWRSFEAIARQCRTSLVVINDLHQVDRTDSRRRTPTYVLKSILEDVGAALLATANEAAQIEGVLAHGPYTNPVMLEQIAGRLEVARLDPYRPDQDNGSTSALDEWAQIIVDFEAGLHLFDHNVGTLVDHTEELLELTQGRIGVLALLLRRAASEVLRRSFIDPSASEQLTIDLLRGVELDYASVTAAR